MRDSPSDHRVRIISQSHDTWRVQVLFQERDLAAHEISERLQEVKHELAVQFDVPDHLLEYSRLLNRKVTRSGLLVQMQIVKQERPARAPAFRAQPLRSEGGTWVPDMILEAKLFPYDEHDCRLSRSVVEARLRAGGFDPLCVDWNTVMEAIGEMEQTDQPVLGLVIGRGVAPGMGKASRVTYGVPRDQEAFLSSAWAGVRPVKRGELLVEVSSPVGGLEWGRNVFGREVEPRQGLQTKLEAGVGTLLSLQGRQLTAHRDGLLHFERCGRDKRDRDSCTMPLAKLVGRVLEAVVFPESQVYRLELTDPAIIFGALQAGSVVRSRAPLFIAGDVERESVVECGSSLRVGGRIRGAQIVVSERCCVAGEVNESRVECGLTLQIDGCVSASVLRGADVIGREIRGSEVEALQQTSFDRVDEGGGQATAIRINLRRFLERQQSAEHEAVSDLQESLAQIEGIFGPEITRQVTGPTAQRMLLRWLRAQKNAGGGNYTHLEVQEFRTILDMVPVIRQQLALMGLEIQEISAQLAACPPEAAPESAAPSDSE